MTCNVNNPTFVRLNAMVVPSAKNMLKCCPMAKDWNIATVKSSADESKVGIGLDCSVLFDCHPTTKDVPMRSKAMVKHPNGFVEAASFIL